MNVHPAKILLALLAAPLAAASAWLVGAVAKYGVHLDKSGVNAAFVAGAAGAIALVAKLIHDVEKRLVRDRVVTPKQVAEATAAADQVIAEVDPRRIDPAGPSSPPQPWELPPNG